MGERDLVGDGDAAACGREGSWGWGCIIKIHNYMQHIIQMRKGAGSAPRSHTSFEGVCLKGPSSTAQAFWSKAADCRAAGQINIRMPSVLIAADYGMNDVHEVYVDKY